MNDAVEKLTQILLPEVDWGYEKEAAEAILAAIQADPLAYVKPKPLEWEGYGDQITASVMGIKTFYVITGSPNDWTLRKMGTGCYEYDEDIETQKAAQAAAYDDLCNRVKELF